MSEDLFGGTVGAPPAVGGGSLADADRAGLPLAVRMRPRTLDEIVGQSHLLAPGSPLRRLAAGEAMSVFLWGPPGSGKTTIAAVVSRQADAAFVELSAVTAGVKEVRAVLDQARRDLRIGEQTVLFVDEVHRFSKAQQDVLLPAVENRLVTLIAATTENPSFSVISPLLSRSLLLTLKPLEDDDLAGLLDRALSEEAGLAGAYELDDDARAMILRLAGGDARRALTYLEEAAAGLGAGDEPGEEKGAAVRQAQAADRHARRVPVITPEAVERAVDKAAIRYDRDGDQHYDVISAFIKSIRGSDVHAALHYLARMIAAGEDPRFIARRLVILASEDIGLADPTALQTAVAAARAIQFIGMPEGHFPLAQAVVHLATAPKSNAVTVGMSESVADVRAGLAGPVPPGLRDAHYAGAKKLGHRGAYVYPHPHPDGVVPQQYPPDALVGKDYYRPTTRGAEATIGARLAKLRAIVRRGRGK